VPSQDIVLGLYYLSMMRDGEPGEGKLFGDMARSSTRCRQGRHLHTKIKARWRHRRERQAGRKVIDTTPGRMMLGPAAESPSRFRSTSSTS
jgi:DNA-directed RNA polymerase subunit beta'